MAQLSELALKRAQVVLSGWDILINCLSGGETVSLLKLTKNGLNWSIKYYCGNDIIYVEVTRLGERFRNDRCTPREMYLSFLSLHALLHVK